MTDAPVAEVRSAGPKAAGLACQASRDPGQAVRHWLEADGNRCLIVFDNATDADILRLYIPVAGAARGADHRNRQSVANLGTRVGVEVFTPAEALGFLSERTGWPVPREAAERGYLPLALAQAAGARLVVPLRWRGQPQSVLVLDEDGVFHSDSVFLCGFVPMIGQGWGRSAALAAQELVCLY